MSYQKELVWATHPDMTKPTRMSREALIKRHRLGWRELQGEYSNGEEENNKKEVIKEDDFKDPKEKSDEYKRLVSEGTIREFTR